MRELISKILRTRRASLTTATKPWARRCISASTASDHATAAVV